MIENAHLSAVIVPALGGKIASLVHRAAMREWLWRNPHLEVRAGEYGASYVARHDLGGFDECFPSVAATTYPTAPWEGTQIPDHGEIWSLPWRAETFCDGARLEVRLVAHGVRFPYRFERTLIMLAGESCLHLNYSVTNLAPFPFPFIWSAHPIFHATPGMRIHAPIREMSVFSSEGQRFGRLGTPVLWPHATDKGGRTWDLSTMPEPGDGAAVKLWGRSPSQGYVALQDPATGAELRLQFDPAEVTHLGLWLNYGGWSGVPGAPPYYNVGIEPCIGAQDDLSLSVRHYGEHGLLPANGRKAWQLDLMVR